MTTEIYRKALKMACETIISEEIGGRNCYKVVSEYLDDERPDHFGVLSTDYYRYFLKIAAAQKAAKKKE
jgi:hypothetical protein